MHSNFIIISKMSWNIWDQSKGQAQRKKAIQIITKRTWREAWIIRQFYDSRNVRKTMRYFKSVDSTIGNQFWDFYYYAKDQCKKVSSLLK